MKQDMTADEFREWYARTAKSRREEDGINDPIWRLCNLYKIADDVGKEIDFRPTPEQMLVIWCICARGWRRIIIPKARQLGMSTVLCLIKFDMMLFNSGITVALVDKTGDDATKKMRKKIQYAWERLDSEVKDSLEIQKKNDSVFSVRAKDEDGDDSISTYEAGTSYRGDTCMFLHCSEWGWIQANDKARSMEIMDGSLPAVERSSEGICVVETTWDGGKAGEVWSLVTEALETPEDAKGDDTWRILFFSWWTHPGYTKKSGFIDDTTAKYFARIAKEKGLTFTDGQKKWYAEMRRSKEERVMQEYPTILEECWEKPVPGAIYGSELAELRASGRLHEFEWDREKPLFTSWDLGMADSIIIWLVQPVGPELHWLDCWEGIGVPLHVAVDKVAEWEEEFKRIQNHYLPHDGGRKANPLTLQSWQQMAQDVGLQRTLLVPRTPDVWKGINRLRPLLRRSRFHTRCDKPHKHDGKWRLSGFGCLEAYRKRVEEGIKARQMEMPIHDDTSHTADAARMFAEAFANKMVTSHEDVVRKHIKRRQRRASISVGGSRKK